MWQGALNANGLPKVYDRDQGRSVNAARLVLTLTRGRRIPAGRAVVNTCGDRRCVSPLHNTALMRQELVRRVFPNVAANIEKTHCPRGHRLAGKNLYRWRGQRHCKTCHRERERERYRRRKAQAS